MFKNKLILLSLITVVVIIAASVFVQLRAPQTEIIKPDFFPELSKQIESINHISIKGYAEEINLSQVNNVWGIDEFDGYPALPDKVRSTVLGTADLKANASKTALPRLYHRLGVEGPEVKDTTSLLLGFKDQQQNDIVSLIVGKPRRSSAAQTSPGLYVRLPDEEQSWLVDGVLDITATKTDWIERSLFDIPAEAVKSVRIDHTDGDTFTLYKNAAGQENFELENLPLGKKLASELIINRFGSLLHDVQISGARSRTKLEAGNNTIRARVITFQGIVIHVEAFELDGIPYASFDVSYDESLMRTKVEMDKLEDVKIFSAELDERLSDWWFEIPSYKYDVMNKRSDSIMRDNKQL